MVTQPLPHTIQKTVPPQISVIIICKNEGKRIRRCLESIRWADEIVIMDSGSSDNTLEICREFTDRIFINRDWPGFGPQRRMAEEHASYDWLLAIDADEIMSPGLQDEIIALRKRLINPDTVYRLSRLTFFCGRFIRHSGWHPDRIVRLYNRQSYRYNKAHVHEAVLCKGARVRDLQSLLLHFTSESLADYIDKRNGYARAWAKAKHAEGKRSTITQATSRAAFAFIRHYILRLGILDGYQGFLIAAIQMQYTFNKYNFLLAKNFEKESSNTHEG